MQSYKTDLTWKLLQLAHNTPTGDPVSPIQLSVQRCQTSRELSSLSNLKHALVKVDCKNEFCNLTFETLVSYLTGLISVYSGDGELLCEENSIP